MIVISLNMGKTAINISILLAIIIIGFAGYYMYMERSSTTLDVSTDGVAMATMLENTRVFMEYGQTLEAVSLDISLLEDERFRSLRSFSTPLADVNQGRSDPFAEVGVTTPNR